ncbi:MAG TPA: CDGSH iron-sulfur domain-containing protein [Acidimicrobiaceae bacterium]|nr:CDGSH iron-sulfur domain-containing protein [Acidimicrobiaceae bacterium]HCB37439.1 CDGSH iron-sulfur domain-containing protein [Acidimicrobiaceae bacterium]
MADDEVTVNVCEDGPLLVHGACTITDPDGVIVVESDGSRAVALCRCGLSTTKPLCNGNHNKGFDGSLNPPS